MQKNGRCSGGDRIGTQQMETGPEDARVMAPVSLE